MEKLLKDGNGYSDNGSGEEMKEQRDNGIESEHRKKSPEENLKIFHDMLAGKAEGWCIRGKMNMQDKFKCLRDPVFFRCKAETHHRHGDKYKAYPTYDFACPIVDALEGVTHAMRTIEYHDRNDGYHWLQKVLGLRSVVIYDYSRLNLVSTVLSKRSLKWFVEEKIADGWNDPRFPTVQGIMRRGMTPDALKKFMLEQGPSKSTNLMEWDKLWAYNKDIIDSTSARYTAIVNDTTAKVIIDNGPELKTEKHPRHQKNPALGEHEIWFGKDLLIEQDDAVDIEVGEKLTLMKWGNVKVTKKDTDSDGKITIHAENMPDDKDFKKTKKITWITADKSTNFEITLVELDHLITKKKVEENEKVQDIVNKNSYIAYTATAQISMNSVKQGDFIQLERRGYFFVDKLAEGDKKMTLNFIPDGKQSNMGKIKSKLDQKEVAGGKADKAVDDAKNKKKAGGEGGEEAKLSKKELNKLKKKEQKANAVAAVKSGAAPVSKEEKKKGGKVPVKDTAIPQRPKDDGSDAVFVKYEATLEK
jgi:glutamyl-tRNA synthetase